MLVRLSLLLALPLSLSGCIAAQFAPAAMEAVRETQLQRQRYSEADFAPAAEEACRGRAARHGRVEITIVEPHDANSVRVYGTIDRLPGSQGRSFACIFRRDGNMTHFKLG